MAATKYDQLLRRLDDVMHETWVDAARREIYAKQLEVAILRDSLLTPAELAAVLEVYEEVRCGTN